MNPLFLVVFIGFDVMYTMYVIYTERKCLQLIKISDPIRIFYSNSDSVFVIGPKSMCNVAVLITSISTEQFWTIIKKIINKYRKT